MDNAEHTLFVCARWGVEREAVGQAVGAQLTPDTMVSLMFQFEQIWMLIESFVTLVMKTRELDGRAKHSPSCASAELVCPRRSGEESRERGFLVLIGIPIPILGESFTTSLKDFVTFPPHRKKKCIFTGFSFFNHR